MRWIASRSDVNACELVGAALAAPGFPVDTTVVCCDDPGVAITLDGVLARLGVPTMGASLQSLEHPVLQVLPLALRLCWTPVDPATLLDLLCLPIGPIRRKWGRKLSAALAQQPGFGSRAWVEAVQSLCTDDDTAEAAKAQERLTAWFDIDRVPRGMPLPNELARGCCSRVAQWAGGRASKEKGNPELHAALMTAAGQAAALGDLIETEGAKVSEPQLARMLESAMAPGVTVQPLRELARGPNGALAPSGCIGRERQQARAQRSDWMPRSGAVDRACRIHASHVVAGPSGSRPEASGCSAWQSDFDA